MLLNVPCGQSLSVERTTCSRGPTLEASAPPRSTAWLARRNSTDWTRKPTCARSSPASLTTLSLASRSCCLGTSPQACRPQSNPQPNKKVVAKTSAVIPVSLPNLADLITYGEITVGVLRPVGCVATATDGHNSLAMLVRRRGETLAQLLTRLDQAIDKALTEDVYTDEINS